MTVSEGWLYKLTLRLWPGVAAMDDRQQAREFAVMDELGVAFIQVPADESDLAAILNQYLPRIFPQERIEVRLFEPESDQDWSAFQVFKTASQVASAIIQLASCTPTMVKSQILCLEPEILWDYLRGWSGSSKESSYFV